MAIEFMDGFDHVAIADLLIKWDTSGNNSNSSIVTGRYAGYALQQGVGGGQSPCQVKTLSGGNLVTRIMGFAVRFYNSFDNTCICGFRDNGANQIELRRTATGYWTVTRNGTVIETSATTYALSTWYYIEFKATIGSGTSGSYEVRLNGATLMNNGGNGCNTQNTANAYANQVFLGSVNNCYQQVDDLYVLRTDTAPNNTFLGECRIFTNLPTGDSSTNKQWTRSTGSNNYALVDEATQNSDTDYTYDATPGHIDTFTFASITPTGGIAAVALNMCARKDDAGTRQIAEETRQSSTEYTSSDTKTLTSSYLIHQNIREVDPATSLPWSASGVNSAEMGVKVIA